MLTIVVVFMLILYVILGICMITHYRKCKKEGKSFSSKKSLGILITSSILCIVICLYAYLTARNQWIAKDICEYAYEVMNPYQYVANEGNYDWLDGALAEVDAYIQANGKWLIKEYRFEGNQIYIRFKYGMGEVYSWFPIPGRK